MAEVDWKAVSARRAEAHRELRRIATEVDRLQEQSTAWTRYRDGRGPRPSSRRRRTGRQQLAALAAAAACLAGWCRDPIVYEAVGELDEFEAATAAVEEALRNLGATG